MLRSGSCQKSSGAEKECFLRFDFAVVGDLAGLWWEFMV